MLSFSFRGKDLLRFICSTTNFIFFFFCGIVEVHIYEIVTVLVLTDISAYVQKKETEKGEKRNFFLKELLG